MSERSKPEKLLPGGLIPGPSPFTIEPGETVIFGGIEYRVASTGMTGDGLTAMGNPMSKSARATGDYTLKTESIKGSKPTAVIVDDWNKTPIKMTAKCIWCGQSHPKVWSTGRRISTSFARALGFADLGDIWECENESMCQKNVAIGGGKHQ